MPLSLKFPKKWKTFSTHRALFHMYCGYASKCTMCAVVWGVCGTLRLIKGHIGERLSLFCVPITNTSYQSHSTAQCTLLHSSCTLGISFLAGEGWGGEGGRGPGSIMSVGALSLYLFLSRFGLDMFLSTLIVRNTHLPQAIAGGEGYLVDLKINI